MSQEEHTLIHLVHKMTHLWDKGHKSYKDKVAVENAWKTISAIMGIYVADCKQLWASIRIGLRERRIIKNLPSGSGAHTCMWPLFEYCGFLYLVIKARRTLSNIVSNSPGCSRELWQDVMLRDDGSLEIETEGSQDGTELKESFDEVEFREEIKENKEPTLELDHIKKIQINQEKKTWK